MTSLTSISLSESRRLALHSQGLLKKHPFGKTQTAILEAIKHLSYVQVDTISVINRAHHHTLFTRFPQYQSQLLLQLQEDKKIFEYWSHAAAYLPVEHFRFSLPRKLAIKQGEKHWHERDPKLMKAVLDRIKSEGPLQAKDFKAPKDWKQKGMWHWKPAKRALEQLFIEGDLMIIKRNNFQKVYDLTERALPSEVNINIPSDEEMARHLIDIALDAHGLITLKQIGYLRRAKIKKHLKSIIQDLLATHEIIKVHIKGVEEPYFVRKNVLESIPKRLGKKQLKLLSPFDNAVIQRERLKQLFDFDYQIECYVPALKRKYGYFCLPILWGDQFVGRLDSKADRKKGVFLVQKLWLEPHLKDFDAFLPSLVKTLWEFAKFHGCDHIEVVDAESVKLKDALTQALKG